MKKTPITLALLLALLTAAVPANATHGPSCSATAPTAANCSVSFVASADVASIVLSAPAAAGVVVAEITSNSGRQVCSPVAGDLFCAFVGAWQPPREGESVHAEVYGQGVGGFSIKFVYEH